MTLHRTADVLTLLGDDVQPLGVLEDPVPQSRKVFCTVRSVGYRERYEAEAHGRRPEIAVKLAVPEEYRGESRCLIGGREYRVIRDYLLPDGGLELTLERKGAAP